MVKNLPANAGDTGLTPESRRKWQPIPIFLPGESQGQRRLAVYSPGGLIRIRHDGTSLVIQWLRLHAPNAGVTGSIPPSGN